MKPSVALMTVAVLSLSLASPAQAELELPHASPGAKVTQTVGLTEVSVEYSSPAVKGRKIWGGLLPYGEVWRAGANAATKVTFSKDVTIADHAVPAGSYALFIIPTDKEWTVILNKKTDQFGAFDYKKDQDLLRLAVKPQPIAHRERLAFTVSDFTDQAGSLDLEWEKVKVSIPFRVSTDAQALANIKAFNDDSSQSFTGAARYMLDKKDYDAGLALIDKSIAAQESWLNLWTKASLLAAKGKYHDAYPLAERAKQLGEKSGRFFAEADVKKALVEWKAKP